MKREYKYNEGPEAAKYFKLVASALFQIPKKKPGAPPFRPGLAKGGSNPVPSPGASDSISTLPTVQPPQPAHNHPSRRKGGVCWGPRQNRRGSGGPVKRELSSFAPEALGSGRFVRCPIFSGLVASWRRENDE